MSELPAALLHRKPKPFYPVHDKSAGASIFKRGDSYRSCVIIPNGPLMVYSLAKRWNQPGTNFYSSVPWPIVGEPFNTNKPRKGRWGEILGTTISHDSALLDDAWDNMKISRKDREDMALSEAKRDLQKRIDICLYGTPREPELIVEACPITRTEF